MLSGTLYVFCLAYLASVVPAIPFSLDLSSASIAAAFGACKLDLLRALLLRVCVSGAISCGETHAMMKTHLESHRS